jgi:nucleoside-diphosphate-sugar epimerase
MINTGTIFLTGLTGSVGSWVAREAMERGFRIIALMRDKTLPDAKARAASALNIVGYGGTTDDLQVVLGDICSKQLGVSDISTVLDETTMIFHCGASTDFEESRLGLSERVNVQGTVNVLDVAAKRGIPLYYMSTAYIAGKRQGTVKENEINVGQSFNNVYEETKCKAETVIGEWTKETSIPTTIFRPSIVVGDSIRGRIVNFNGMYNLLRCFDTFGPMMKDQSIRAIANPKATKNFVPVDYLAKTVWDIVEAGTCGTYHITHSQPITVGRIREIFSELFSLGHVEFVEESEFQKIKPTRAEKIYRKASLAYTPYLESEPLFDMTNTDAVLGQKKLEVPDLDTECFKILLDHAQKRNWGKDDNTQKTMKRELFAEPDQYFGDFLPEKMHRRLLANLKNLSATFRIVMKENPEVYWSLAIEQGILTHISRNGMVCDCSFIINTSTFTDIVSARVTPQKAFFKKQVDIEGDTETGLKLVTVLAAFFKKHPYNTKGRNG